MQLKEYHHILVPVDGSKATEAVVAQAAVMAKAHHANLELLNVVQVAQFSDGIISGISLDKDQTYNLSNQANERLQDLKKELEATGVEKVGVHVRFGNPKQVIAHDFVKDHQIDLIVMGATGLSAVERMVVGSVTQYATRNADADVLVVKINKDDFKVKSSSDEPIVGL